MRKMRRARYCIIQEKCNALEINYQIGKSLRLNLIKEKYTLSTFMRSSM